MPRTKSRHKQATAVRSTITLTHPDRVLYADGEITKRDVADYYAKVADLMLPHVVGRPLNLVRCPAGTNDACFFQKHPPQGLSNVVERITVKERSGSTTYLVVHDLEGILALVQFGVLEFHIWGARADDLERPDRLVFDLDPDPTIEWQRVVDAARWTRELLEVLGLSSFVKTTGGKGLHVVAPFRRKYGWDEVKQFTKAIADLLVVHRPRRLISKASKAARRGKIFIDYLRNDRGSTWVAPYSTRARPRAPISLPVEWDDLSQIRSADQSTLGEMKDFMEKAPWKLLPDIRQSLTMTMFNAVGIKVRSE